MKTRHAGPTFRFCAPKPRKALRAGDRVATKVISETLEVLATRSKTYRIYPTVPAEYRADDCMNGGEWDVNPERDVWPCLGWKPVRGLEPPTRALQERRSTN